MERSFEFHLRARMGQNLLVNRAPGPSTRRRKPLFRIKNDEERAKTFFDHKKGAKTIFYIYIFFLDTG